MPRYLLRLEFDGSPHCGWQTQGHELPDPRGQAHEASSVQFEIERAVAKILGRTDRLAVTGCGRTDAGVHAEEYFCHFDHEAPIDELERFRHGLNAVLPDNIAVQNAYRIPQSFSAIESVRSKTYEYRVLLRRAKPALDKGRCHWLPLNPSHFDFGKLDQALKVLEGEHDFRAFMAAGSDVKTTVRTILSATSHRQMRGLGAEMLSLRFHGAGFLKHMVRNLTGTVLEIGIGKRELATLPQLLDQGARTEAGFCAPPEGLFLKRVDYGEEGLDGYDRVPE